ncbi:MAG: gluconokinase [Chitinophagaceae bacterium]
MNYYIGIDIGTTSTKAVAFAENGDIIARETIGYAIHHPQPNYSEQNPDEILEAVINSIYKITTSLSKDNPLLISFSAAMHSIMAVDEKGNLLTNCIIWADNRACEIADQLRATQTGIDFYHKTGVPIHAMSPFCKLLWFKENQFQLFSKTARFIGIKEYIFYKIFGKYIVDTQMASATGLLNINSLQWDETILAYTGVSAQHLSEVVDSTQQTYLTTQSNYFEDKRLKQVLKTAFIIGGSDGALANLGSDAITPNVMAISIGTSCAVRVATNGVYTDEKMRTFCYHLYNNQYIVGGAGSNGAIVLQWLRDNILQSKEAYEQFFQQANTIPAGCDGLIFIPYLLGERAPIWNSHAKGVFFGLDITHTRAHMVRAAMEAVIYHVYSIGKVLMENNHITEIQATGGFTQNPIWLQTLCDMFNCTVLVSGAVESSAAGAVKLGMKSLSIEKKWTLQTTERYEPDALQHQTYLQQFEKFERIYGILKAEMSNNESNKVIAGMNM